jgi:hypothetical protein
LAVLLTLNIKNYWVSDYINKGLLWTSSRNRDIIRILWEHSFLPNYAFSSFLHYYSCIKHSGEIISITHHQTNTNTNINSYENIYMSNENWLARLWRLHLAMLIKYVLLKKYSYNALTYDTCIILCIFNVTKELQH